MDGVRGTLLEPSTLGRGVASSRTAVGDFELTPRRSWSPRAASAATTTSSRPHWPERLGAYPEGMLTGVPAHVDGRMLAITESAGASIVNSDRMWHYTEGVANWDPIWPGHGIRILPGPSSLWLDATGRRLPVPLFPGFDTLGTLDPHPAHRAPPHLVRADPEDHREGVRALGVGAEPGPHRPRRAPGARPGPAGAPAPVEAFKQHGDDFVVRDDLRSLVDGMNALTDTPLLSYDDVAPESSPATGRWPTRSPRTCR